MALLQMNGDRLAQEGMVDRRFLDKTVIVTGASSGIGAATAHRFAAEGANVVVVARRAEELRRVAAALGNQGKSLAVAMDVTDLEAATGLLDRSEQRFGAVHVLVNNAGFNSHGPVESKQVQDLARIINVDLLAPMIFCRLALPYLRRAGWGAIVNVASLAGRLPIANEASYSAAKSGLRLFTLALAEELRGSGISASVLSPGPVDTGFIMSKIEQVPDVVFSQPMRSAEDIASLVLECACRGTPERPVPRLSGYVTTLAYLFPRVYRLLKPVLEARGRAVKRKYLDRKG